MTNLIAAVTTSQLENATREEVVAHAEANHARALAIFAEFGEFTTQAVSFLDSAVEHFDAAEVVSDDALAARRLLRELTGSSVPTA